MMLNQEYTFDVLKLSQSTITSTQNKSKCVLSPNEAATSSKNNLMAAYGKVKFVSYSPIDTSNENLQKILCTS